MGRLTADKDKNLLGGAPELLCIVAEQMAYSDSVREIRTAIRQAIAQRIRDRWTLTNARLYAMAALLQMDELAERRARRMTNRGVDRGLLGLFGMRAVQVLLAADHVLSILKRESRFPFPKHEQPRELIVETAKLAQEDPAALPYLRKLVDSRLNQYVPMAAIGPATGHGTDDGTAGLLRWRRHSG